jgi:tetratricopeptide (TPR) repeat protein
VGCGAGQFFIFYPLYRDPEYFTHPLSVDSTDHAHCEILELISEIGLLGFISFFMFLFFLIYFVIKNINQREREVRICVYSILTGVFLLMFENLFDVNMRYMSSKFVFWSFLGWCYGLSNQTDVQSKALRSLNIFQKSVCLILALFVLASGFLIPFISDYYFRKGVKERALEQYESAIRYYHKSVKLWPKHIEAQYRLGYLYGLLGFKEKAVGAYLEVIRAAPFFASVHGNLGAVYSQLDQLEYAYQHLSIQIKLNPYDSNRLCILASVLIRMGKIEEGKILLRRALLNNPQHEFALTVLQKLRDDESRFKTNPLGDSAGTDSRSHVGAN